MDIVRIIVIIAMTASIIGCNAKSNTDKQTTENSTTTKQYQQGKETQAILNNSGKITSPNLKYALEEKWYQDADGNAIPDFIESASGFNPNADDCAPDVSMCGE